MNYLKQLLYRRACGSRLRWWERPLERAVAAYRLRSLRRHYKPEQLYVYTKDHW